MIGISIHADSVRAVRLAKNRKQFAIKDCYMKDLFEGDIIQGRLVNPESLIDALLEIKQELDISDTEEVHVGLPDGITKIDNMKFRSEVFSKEQFLSDIQLFGNKQAFDVSFPFISPNVRVALKQDYETSEKDKDGKVIPKFGAFKKVSYVAIQKADLQAYVDAFAQTELNVVSIEPNGVAIVKYLQHDATQPFLAINIEYDYTSLIAFSQADGLYMLNASDLGSKYLTNVEYDEYDNPTNVIINNRNVRQLSSRIRLAMEYYVNNGISENPNVQQLVMLNEQYPFIDEMLDKDFPDTETLSAHDMLPEGISAKLGKDINYDDLFLFYVAMVVAMNKNEDVFKSNTVEKKVGLNILPASAKTTANYKKTKVLITKALSAVVGLAGLYFLGVTGVNGYDFMQATSDSGKVTDELRAKYDDAKKQNTTMKDNIAKFNTVAVNKKAISPILDKLISSKPPAVKFSNVIFNYKNKKAIIECVSDDMISPNELLNTIKENPEFSQAQILSTQTQKGKVAFQIVVPLVL